MKKQLFFMGVLFLTMSLYPDQFEFVLANRTCHQLEVMCSSGSQPNLVKKLFPFTQTGFVINTEKPLFIKWHSVYGSLKRFTIEGMHKKGVTYGIAINPQQTPYRDDEGSIEIIDDQGHYKSKLTKKDYGDSVKAQQMQ